MSSPIHYIAYASRITLPASLNNNIFLDIQQQSIKNNTNSGITGFLLFKDGKFFQYFEGEELICLQLLNVLKQDNRHQQLTILAQGDIENRLFNDWAMSCFNLSEEKYPIQLNEKVEDFDVYTWQEADVQKVISNLSSHYFHHFKPEEVSYLKLLLKKAISQNRLFLIVQLILSVCILLSLLSLIFLK